MDLVLNSSYYTYLILPLLIFFARICDVTFGTVRIILVSKGIKRLAPLLGFIEVFIWVLAISQIMANLNNWVCYFAYALGFATGNYVGMLIEEKIAMGTMIVRVMISDSGSVLVKILNNRGFGTTVVHGDGSLGKVDIVYTVVDRKDLDKVESIIKEYNANSFYTIEEIKKVNKGIFPRKGISKVGGVVDRWRIGR